MWWRIHWGQKFPPNRVSLCEIAMTAAAAVVVVVGPTGAIQQNYTSPVQPVLRVREAMMKVLLP